MTKKRVDIKAVNWEFPPALSHPPTKIGVNQWLVKTQQDIEIEKVKRVNLHLSFESSRGCVLVSLTNEWKEKHLSLLNEVVAEDGDIKISLLNHSSETITIPKGSKLCYVIG